MLIRTIVVAAPLLLGAPQGESADSSKKQEEQPSVSGKGEPVPGQGQSPGAHGGGPAGPGAGTQAGTAGGREDQTAAGEKGDTTSGAKSGRWDESGGKTAPQQGGSSAAGAPGDAPPRGHERDFTVAGKLSRVSDDAITIETAPGKSHELKVVPQTRFTVGGKDAKPGQLSEGQQVRASYMEHGGERIAVQIQASGGTAEPEREKTHNPRNNPQAEEKK
jgi:hypothetical protein